MRTNRKRVRIEKKDMFLDVIKARFKESLAKKKDVHAGPYPKKLLEFGQDPGHGQIQGGV